MQRVWTFRLRLMLSSSNACLIVAGAPVAFISRFTQNMMLFLNRNSREIA
jgi:hypothetical protein